jgi:hypothetical protein
MVWQHQRAKAAPVRFDESLDAWHVYVEMAINAG